MRRLLPALVAVLVGGLLAGGCGGDDDGGDERGGRALTGGRVEGTEETTATTTARAQPEPRARGVADGRAPQASESEGRAVREAYEELCRKRIEAVVPESGGKLREQALAACERAGR